MDQTDNGSRETYNPNSQTTFKTLILKSGSCDYSDAYILIKGTITVPITTPGAAVANNGDKKVMLKTCVLFTYCINEANNTQEDNAKDIDVAIPMYNLTEYCGNYSKTSESL